MEPRIQYAQTKDGVSIAYSAIGDGQPFLARVDPRTKARPGHDIQVAFDVAQMHAFDPQTETVIGAAERP